MTLALYIPFFSAIIITGRNKVEILHSNGSYWCSLPYLPQSRSGHTQSGLLACGGFNKDESDIRTSCSSFTDGHCRTSYQLQQSRHAHSSWMSQHGVLLIGGTGSQLTTEILTKEGQSSASFTLKYKIR